MTPRERLSYVILSGALIWACCAGGLTAIAYMNRYLEHTACLRTAALDHLPPRCD